MSAVVVEIISALDSALTLVISMHLNVHCTLYMNVIVDERSPFFSSLAVYTYFADSFVETARNWLCIITLLTYFRRQVYKSAD